MATQISDKPEAQRLSAYVILNKKGVHVATVRAHYAKAGGVTVEVRNMGFLSESTSQRSGGWGYDKFTSALAGQTVDGHQMTDHCDTATSPNIKRGHTSYGPDDKRIKKGYHLANANTSCFRRPGLEYLTAIGYTVIQAL